MTKVNLSSFTQPEITARLFSLLRRYNRECVEPTREQHREYVTEVAEQNFTFAPEDHDKVVTQLELFFLGNQNNSFSKLVEL